MHIDAAEEEVPYPHFTPAIMYTTRESQVTMKTSYNQPNSKSIERVVVLLRRPSEQAPREDDERFDRALDQLDQLHSRLRILIDSVQKVWDRPLSPISIIWEKRLSGSDDLNAHLLGRAAGIRTVALSPQTRAFVSLVPIRDSDTAESPKAMPSHIITVALAPGSESTKWRPALGLSSAIVEASLETYTSVVEEICLDIAMFHSWPQLDEAFQTSEQRRAFSRLKVKYISTSARDLPLSLTGVARLAYVSFASVARKNGQLDYLQYVQLWRDFVLSLGLIEPPVGSRPRGLSTLTKRRRIKCSPATPQAHPQPEDTAEVLNKDEGVRLALDFILRYHRNGPQISRRVLKRLLHSLSPGSYVLIRAESKPRLGTIQTTINAFFGARQWRTGRLLAVPSSELSQYLVYRRYISIFRFVIDVSYRVHSEGLFIEQDTPLGGDK